MNCFGKYQLYRSEFKDGDIVLFRGQKLLAKTIQYFDNSYFNHVGVCFKFKGRIMIIDSNGNGVRPDFMSYRMKDYVDFGVIRTKYHESIISHALSKTFERGDDMTKYDFLLLPRIALIKKTGINLTKLGSDNRDICSELVKHFTNAMEMNCYRDVKLITPEDFIRYRDTSLTEILFTQRK